MTINEILKNILSLPDFNQAIGYYEKLNLDSFDKRILSEGLGKTFIHPKIAFKIFNETSSFEDYSKKYIDFIMTSSLKVALKWQDNDSKTNMENRVILLKSLKEYESKYDKLLNSSYEDFAKRFTDWREISLFKEDRKEVLGNIMKKMNELIPDIFLAFSTQIKSRIETAINHHESNNIYEFSYFRREVIYYLNNVSDYLPKEELIDIYETCKSNDILDLESDCPILFTRALKLKIRDNIPDNVNKIPVKKKSL